MKKTLLVLFMAMAPIAGAVIVDIDYSATPDCADWAKRAKSITEEWYPRICNLLASESHKSPDTILLTFLRKDDGIAYSFSNEVHVCDKWIKAHPEDIGLVVHELVHVAQGYGHGGRGNSWLTEGIADYIRWAVYEGKPLGWFPLSKRADGYHDSYQVTGGFLLWLESSKAPGIVRKANAALRAGKYNDSLFAEVSGGESIDELWKQYVEERKKMAEVVIPEDWQITPFIRPVSEPVIAPIKDTVFDCPMRGKPMNWESSDTFNPAAVVKDGKICVLYRAEDGSGNGIGDHTSRIGLATSTDGIHFERRSEPVFYPADDEQKRYEWYGGCEDPRVVEGPDGRYYMYYSMWNKNNPEGERSNVHIGVASSTDLITWEKHGPIFSKDMPVFESWHKAAAPVTAIRDGRLKAVRINGLYWMYFGERQIQVAISRDLIHWEPVKDDNGKVLTIIRPRKGKFDSNLTEAGPPAVLTDKGIVLMYNGKNSDDKSLDNGAYAAGQLLLDPENPTRLLERCDNYFFKPEEDYEKSGQYASGTVFIEGLVYHNSKWLLYFGAADSFVGVAVCEDSE
jgi:predicted GH43/DUF377 family glycosyl hydrolase